MKKVCINKCFGGFSLSNAAIQRYGELAGLNLVSKDKGYNNQWYIDSVDDENFFSIYNIPRDDPILIQVVEELGEASWGGAAEVHRTWS